MSSLTKITPFIRRINTGGGGTFYIFQSSAEDLTLSISETANRKLIFSKFALLNIPDILEEPSLNTLKLKAIPGAYFQVDPMVSTDWNFHFAESFQNYCLNLETSILSDTNYDYDIPLTISERVFWKWLKEMGGIRFQEYGVDGSNNILYTEEENSSIYNRVVKYIGKIDYINNIFSSINSYTEVYVHIPTECGEVPDVLFKIPGDGLPTEDVPDTDPYNFISGKTFTKDNNDINDEIIMGHEYDEIHPDSLRILAFYDNDIGNPLLDGISTTPLWLYRRPDNSSASYVKDYYSNRTGSNWWYDNTTDTNQYILSSNFFDPSNDYLALSSTEITTEEDDVYATKLIRSRLEGTVIDWNVSDYTNVYYDGNYETLLDLARTPQSGDFEFNAILIYYDLFDSLTDITTTSKPLASNLFGVLFLNKVESTSLGGGTIPRFTKCVPNEIFNINGNSYGFKLNIKLNTSPITSGIEVESIQSDSNTLSLDIYSNAMSEMIKVSDLILNNELRYKAITDRLQVIEDTAKLLNKTDLTKFATEYLSLKEDVAELQTILPSDASTFVSKLELVESQIESMLSGKADINLVLDFKNLLAGNGINILQNSAMNQAIISAKNNLYNYDTKIVINQSDYTLVNSGGGKEYLKLILNLKNFKNYVRFEETNLTVYNPGKTIKIYINDKNVKWSVGQAFRFYFKTAYNMSSSFKNLEIYSIINTDNSYPVNPIATISYQEFELRNGRPNFEIHCYDNINNLFFLDFLN